MDSADAPPVATPEPFAPPAAFPRDWYWLADDGRIYGSMVQGLVSASSPAYIEWGKAGYIPTKWPLDDLGQQTDAALHDVVAPYGLSIGGYAAIPERCSKLGLKRALAETGPDAVFAKPEWPTVKAAIAASPDLQEDWDLAISIVRTDPLVQAMISARKYDDVTVDKILVRANTLAV